MDLEERIGIIQRHVGAAVAAVNADKKASPVLKAVVQELNKKSEKARGIVKGGDPKRSHDVLIEVEEAADCAKAAAEADTGLAEATKKAIVEAHDAYCTLKFDAMGGR